MYCISSKSTLFPAAGNSDFDVPGHGVHSDIPLLVKAAGCAWDLIAVNEQRIECWIPAVVDAVRARYIATRSTAEKTETETRSLLRYLSRTAGEWQHVTAQMVTDWCCTGRPDAKNKYQPVATNTASNRMWVAGAALKATAALGAIPDANSLLGSTIKREASAEAMRPLTETEAGLVRRHARGGVITTLLPLLVALSFAGASAAEIAQILLGDIDAERGFVRLRGEHPRVNPCDDWGQATIRFHLRNRPGLNPRVPLCVTPGLPLERATKSVTVRLHRVLTDAGISHRPGVVPRSIRHTTAHRIAHAHGIVAAADFLGADRVDDVIAVFKRAVPEGGSDV